MITRIFYNTIFGYVLGNFLGLFKKMFSEEKPIWTSRFYFRYRNFKEYSFLLVWASLAIVFSAVFILFVKETNIISSFFFITGSLILLQFIHYFDRILLFPNRIEKRFFFHCLQTISFKDIKIILRDKKTKNFSDIIYYHSTYGIYSLGSNRSEPWKIPPELFLNPNLKISQSKLHPNLFEDYEVVKSKLPEFPIEKEKISWKKVSLTEKIMFYSILILNPYSLLIILGVFFGIFYNNLFFISLIEFSRVYSKAVFQIFLSKAYNLKSPSLEYVKTSTFQVKTSTFQVE